MRRILTLLLLATLPAVADVKLPTIFSDHLALQKMAKAAVWGWAKPGEQVTLTLGPDKGVATAATRAGADGRWRVHLDLHDAGPGPYELTVQGANKIVVRDVLVGEVWFCGGQSNMELPVSRTIDAEKVIAASADSRLRVFHVRKKPSTTPLDNVEGSWTLASPATTGAYPAVGYYFARALAPVIKAPLGLIDCNYGGSGIETWMSAETLAQDPTLHASAEKALALAADYPARLKEYHSLYAAWQAVHHRADKPAAPPATFAAPGIKTADWKLIDLSKPFASAGLPDNGAIWLRKTLEVTPSQAGLKFTMRMGVLHDFDAVYWNGELIGSTTGEQSTSQNDGAAAGLNRRYDVPAELMKVGPAVLAIRLFAPAGGMGIEGEQLKWEPWKTGWLAKTEYELPPLSADARASYPVMPPVPSEPRNTATMFFNGMVHPIIPFPIRGILWYQGESNASRAVQYATSFPLLIKSWRAAWGEGDLPFYFCQLANWQAKLTNPGDSQWAELREAQSAALALPQTGEAVLIDLGEQDDIHFRDKRSAGERLARLALARTYGQKAADSGPVYTSMETAGAAIRLHFQSTEGGLVARPLPKLYAVKSTLPADHPLIKNSPESELQGFQICGADSQWAWANAKIDGTTVVVTSPQVPAPVAVRYAWANNPTCNLYNGAGLPASPFRTDTFPLTTTGKNY